MDLERLRASLAPLLAELGISTPPLELRPMHGGRSGAFTYDLHTASRRLVLRVQPSDRFSGHFQQMAILQRIAAARGLAPAVIHVEAERRWLLTEYVDDRNFLASVQQPTESSRLIALLGTAIAELHECNVPEGLAVRTPRELTFETFRAVEASFPLPAFAARVRDDLAARPVFDAAPVLCHHDLNPTNVLFDGTRIMFGDWETAGAGNGLFDLATVMNLLLLDGPRSRTLLARYVAARGIPMPDASDLAEARRLAYAAYGITFLELAGTPGESFEGSSLPTVAECYQAAGAGRLDLSSSSGYHRLGAAMFGAYFSVTP